MKSLLKLWLSNEEITFSSDLEVRVRIQSDPGSNPSPASSCLFHFGVNCSSDSSPDSFNNKTGENDRTYFMGLVWDFTEIINVSSLAECVHSTSWARIGHWLNGHSPQEEAGRESESSWDSLPKQACRKSSQVSGFRNTLCWLEAESHLNRRNSRKL